ncbi:MAG: PAS domain S-box protein, partial [Marinilabiliales bacterium]|nr:PAS domain S-box protein [Marinilabiliales bacterium]
MVKGFGRHKVISARASRLLAFLVVIISCVAILGQLTGRSHLTRLSDQEVEMAPITAIMLLLYGLMLLGFLFFQITGRGKRPLTGFLWMLLTLSFIVLLFRLIAMSQSQGMVGWAHVQGVYFNFFHQMSTVSDLFFLGLGLSALALMQNKLRLVNAGLVVVHVASFVSLIILLSYLLKTPFFYKSDIQPPASLTMICFFFSSLSLLLASARHSLLVSNLLSQSTNSRLMTIFIPLILAIILVESLIIVHVVPHLPVNPAIGISLMTICFLMVVGLIIPYVSSSLARSLDEVTEDLRSSEEKFRQHFEYSPMGQTLSGRDHFIHVNKSFCDMLGYSEEELMQKTPMELTHPEDQLIMLERLDALIEGREQSIRYEKRYCHKSGQIVWCDISSFLLRDVLGNPLYFISTISNITRRKRTENALRESELRYRTLFSQMNEGFTLQKLLSDEKDNIVDYQILEFNPIFRNMFDLTAKKVKGVQASTLFGQNPPPFLAVYTQVAKTGVPHRFQLYMATHGKHLDISAFSPYSGYVAAIFSDITDMRRAEEALSASESRLKELNSTKDKFFSIIAHDLKSPFNAIVGFSELLKEQVKEKDYEEIEEYAGIIHASAARSLELLKNLFD